MLDDDLLHWNYRRLAAAVLLQGFRDLNTPIQRHAALRFLTGGAGLWCDACDLPPEVVRQAAIRHKDGLPKQRRLRESG